MYVVLSIEEEERVKQCREQRRNEGRGEKSFCGEHQKLVSHSPSMHQQDKIGSQYFVFHSEKI